MKTEFTEGTGLLIAQPSITPRGPRRKGSGGGIRYSGHRQRRAGPHQAIQVSQLLKLGRGAVVELDRKLGEAIDVYVNNRLVARGEVVMVDETRLGITMTEIVKADRSN